MRPDRLGKAGWSGAAQTAQDKRNAGTTGDHDLFCHAAMPLEYHGLALDYWFIDQLPLPVEPLVGRYAGVVAWLGEDASAGEGNVGRYESLCARLKNEIDAGLPVIFMGYLPAGQSCRNLIDYQGELRPATRALKLVKASEQLGRPNTAPYGSERPIHVRDKRSYWLTAERRRKIVSSTPAREGQ
jgi:hypothetical protein